MSTLRWNRPPDTPRRKRSVPRSTVIELSGSAVAATALVWLTFTVAGITGPLGFAFCVLAAFLAIYGLICWQLYGVLSMKDRLATVAIWSGAVAAFIPLVAVILYVVFQGISVVFARFPHFSGRRHDGSDGDLASHCRGSGGGHRRDGRAGRYRLSHHRPPGCAHCHLPGEQPERVLEGGQHRRRRDDWRSGHHRGAFHIPPVGRAAEGKRPDRVSPPRCRSRS